MQVLPLLEPLWPGHFIFRRHPILSLDRGHPKRKNWEAWSSVQVQGATEAAMCYESQEIAGEGRDMMLYVPGKVLTEQAYAIGAQVTMENRRAALRSDPVRARLLRQVRCVVDLICRATSSFKAKN